MRLRKNTRFLVTLAGVFAIGVAVGLLISSPILSIFFGTGGIAVIALLRDAFKDILASGKRPFIDYNDVKTKRWTQRQHGGEYTYTTYFLIITNATRNTTAEGCKASIESLDIPISRFYAIWQISDSEGISIAQDEPMRLFTISDFKSPTETQRQIDFHTRQNNQQYNFDGDLPQKQMRISIQCTNGDFPAEPYIKTIKEIMNEVD
jgi:hypothetical protein